MKIIGKVLKNKSTKAFGYYLIGNLFDKTITFLTIPIFTRIMSTSDYGIVNTYLSWVSILSLIVGLSLGNSIRSAYIDFKEDLEEYISSILFLSIINFIGSSILIILFAYFFIKNVDIILVILCLVQSFMTFIINTITIKYMMKIDYKKRTLLLAIPNIIITILSVVFLLIIPENKYFGRIIPYVIVTSVVGIFYLISYLYKNIKKLINKKYWVYGLKLSLPLIFHGLCINILATSDRTMISIFRSTSEAGVYSLIYSFGMISTVITTSLESIWIPWFNKKIEENQKSIINDNVRIYIEVVMIAMIGILFISPEVLVLMSPKEYWGGKVLVAPILLASFLTFLYSISVNLEYYYKSTKIIATNTIIAALINLVLNFIFIPLYGATAAAFTTVFAYTVSFVIHYSAARRLDNELFPFKIYVKPILIIIFSVIISYLIIDYTILRWLIMFIGFSIYFIFGLKKRRFEKLIK